MDTPASQAYNWLAIIWPVALTAFVVWFFRAYKASVLPKRKSRRKRARLPKAQRPELSLLGQPGCMGKRDLLIAFSITVAYAIVSFSFAGDAAAPQTFLRITPDAPQLTLDLGETVLLDNILYYPGLEDQATDEWVLELSADGQTWSTQPYMSHRFFDAFSWKIPLLEDDFPKPVRYIRLTTTVWRELGELVLLVVDEPGGGRTRFDTAALSEKYPEYAALFDEQALAPALPDQGNNEIFNSIADTGSVPGRIADHSGGLVFDEVHHARAAYEYIRGAEPAEMTHPPLGKILISIGISIFGMTPFGWRFMGILLGILMVPLLYALVKKIFDSTSVAALGAALLAFENLHFTQSRLATIDTPLVFFILLMYMFMYRFISSGYEAPFKKTLPPLIFCGLSFGLGVATKWSAFYAALGLVALYVAYLVKRGRHQAAAGQGRQFRKYLLQTLAASVAFFVAVPFAIYTLSYIPVTAAYGHPLTAPNLLRVMWENQGHMIAHHGDPARDAAHLYSSSWWMWMLNIRPMFYYAAIHEGARTFVGALTNPLVTLGGLVAMGFAAHDAVRNRAKAPFFIVLGYLAQLLPWVFVSRSTFVYHYYPSVIFLVLAICYIFDKMLKQNPDNRKKAYLFTAVSATVFLMLFPLSAGLTTPNWYSEIFTRWLPTWPF